MNEVILGLGANEGDPWLQLRLAVARIAEVVTFGRVSSVYRTAPEGRPDQPDYLNLVCVGQTGLTPMELLQEMQAIERALGRDPRPRNAPRRIDVDLLAFADRVLSSPDLIVPHPRLQERAFVLVPLVEIAPGWRHPAIGLTAQELLAALKTPGRVEALGPLDLP
jgi:2-amino-4-hydroxy-6-hydroxymethyldihydropteridine diphosphokinase